MVADAFAGEQVFDVEEVVGAAGDVQQCGHRGDLLDLFLEEPEHELLAQGIVFGPGGGEEFLDVFGDFLFLREGQGQWFLDVGEVVGDGLDAGDGVLSPRSRMHRTIIMAWFRSSNDWR